MTATFEIGDATMATPQQVRSRMPLGQLRGFDPAAAVAFRTKLGMTPAQLAILTGVSTESIWSWEAGRYSPAAPAAKRLADALHVGVAHLTTIAPNEATLTDLRHWQGFTAGDAADAAGLTKRQIWRLEQYVVAPKPQVREALARVYEVSLEQFDAAWLRGREEVLGDLDGRA